MKSFNPADKVVDEFEMTAPRRKRKSDAIAQAMYAQHIAGKQITEIARIYRKHPTTIYTLFRTRGLAIRPRKINEGLVVDGMTFRLSPWGFRFQPHEGRKKTRQILLHRYLWEKLIGPIPPGFYIRYKNGDYHDNRIENLECVEAEDVKRSILQKNDYNRASTSLQTIRARVAAKREDRWRRVMAI